MELSKEFMAITDEQLTLFVEKKLSITKAKAITNAIKTRADLWLFANICMNYGLRSISY